MVNFISTLLIKCPYVQKGFVFSSEFQICQKGEVAMLAITEFISFSMTVGHQSNWHFRARQINWLLLVMNMAAAKIVKEFFLTIKHTKNPSQSCRSLITSAETKPVLLLQKKFSSCSSY